MSVQRRHCVKCQRMKRSGVREDTEKTIANNNPKKFTLFVLFDFLKQNKSKVKNFKIIVRILEISSILNTKIHG